MAIKGEWINYEGGTGYLARPEHAVLPLPGVIVIQEIMGVDEHIEDVTRRVAAAGYAALAPDLYAKDGRRPDPLSRERFAEMMDAAKNLPPGSLMDPSRRDAALASLPEPQRGRVRETVTAMSAGFTPAGTEDFVRALVLACRTLRNERPETSGRKVACVGFCMGGGLSSLLSCAEPSLAGAAVFYGMTPPAEMIGKTTVPVMAFYGELDQRVNAGIPAFTDGMARAGRDFDHHVYPGAAHGFFCDGRASYNVDAARDSWVRMMEFFRRALVE